MMEAAAIATAAATLRERRSPVLVATVVRIEGSSYRRPGARLIATTEGRVAGSVSGGCLERDLLRTGFWRARNGPVLVRYDSRDLDDGERMLGCGGLVELLLEQGTAGGENDPLAPVAHALSSDRPVTLATVFRSTDDSVPLGAIAEDRLAAIAPASKAVLEDERPTCLELATDRGVIDMLVEPIRPPPHLFILGAGPDALPLAAMARHLGWRVTTWAGPARELDVLRSRIDGCDRAMAVVMSHDIPRDRAALDMVVRSRAFYIGVLGPRSRTAKLAGADVLSDPRIHAPVGLDLGAETPEEISVSIASEILASIRHASRAALRQRESIHT
jgi:xanthine/CO dehydrogenase XdhC/CoxF family maturation factor